MVLKCTNAALCVSGWGVNNIKTAAAIILATGAANAWAAPVAQDDARQAPQNIPVVVDVLSNDSGDGVLTIADFTQPANGAAQVSRGAGGGLRVVPNQNFWGRITFSYRITDDSGEFSQAQVSLVVERTQTDADALAQTLPLNTVVQINREALAGHSRAVSQFNRTRKAQSQQGQWVYRGANLGGGAGDSPLALGGLFVSLQASQINSDTAGYQRAFDADISGATIGADFNLNTQWLVGGAVGASAAQVDTPAGAAIAETDEQSLLAFASYRHKSWLAEWQVGVSSSDTTGKGGLVYSMQGQSSFGLGKLEYAFAGKQWQLMPGFSLQYQRNHLEAFNTQTAGRNTNYAAQTASHWLGAFSLYGDYAFTFNWGVVIPQLTLASEYCIDKSSQNSVITINDEPFSVMAAQAYDSHQLTIDAGVALLLTHGFSGFINYHHLAKNKLYSTQAWQAGIRWEF